MRDGERTQYCAEICAFKTVASQRQLWAPALSHYPPYRPPKKSVCPLTDRQMNNPVGGNIIIDALTFTWSALQLVVEEGKKKKTHFALKRLVIWSADRFPRRHQRPSSFCVGTLGSGGRWEAETFEWWDDGAAILFQVCFRPPAESSEQWHQRGIKASRRRFV